MTIQTFASVLGPRPLFFQDDDRRRKEACPRSWPLTAFKTASRQIQALVRAHEWWESSSATTCIVLCLHLRIC